MMNIILAFCYVDTFADTLPSEQVARYKMREGRLVVSRMDQMSWTVIVMLCFTLMRQTEHLKMPLQAYFVNVVLYAYL